MRLRVEPSFKPAASRSHRRSLPGSGPPETVERDGVAGPGPPAAQHAPLRRVGRIAATMSRCDEGASGDDRTPVPNPTATNAANSLMDAL